MKSHKHVTRLVAFLETFSEVDLDSKLLSLTRANSFLFAFRQEQTGPSVNLKITVTLEEVYTGADFELQYNRQIICPHCRGSAADDPEHVKECN